MEKKYDWKWGILAVIILAVVLVMMIISNSKGILGTSAASLPAASSGSEMAVGAVVETESPTPDALQAALERARNFSGGNNDWEPFEFDFDGVTMVLVPAGCFQMGLDEAQANYIIDELGADIPLGDEQPVHEQCFDMPFWIDKYEVTNEQFARFNGVASQESRWTGENRPRENILWFEARDYCALRGARLPTEREWEYVARGPDNLLFPWGNEWNPANLVWSENSSWQTSDVGSNLDGQSWVGALDMSGNVFEWTSTIYGIERNFNFNYSDPDESQYTYPYNGDDGREQDSEEATYFRVVRGSSWRTSFPYDFRTTIRVGFPPNLGYDDYGVRCARSLS